MFMYWKWEKMYLKTICPKCRKAAYHSVSLHCLETTNLYDPDSVAKYVIEYIEVKDSVPEEELVRDILYSMHQHVSDGIEVKEICKVLTKYYGIAAAYCCDLVQKIKIELDMYCPDRKHLYFVCPKL